MTVFLDTVGLFYAIFYRLYDETVIVIGCMHGRRDPRRWKGRA